jgi:hypothetical protein
MNSTDSMRIKLDIHTKDKKRWSGGVKLKLNTLGLKGSL